MSDRLLPVLSLATDSSGLVVAGTDPPPDAFVTSIGLYSSTDDGTTWEPVWHWRPQTNGVALDAQGVIYGATPFGLARGTLSDVNRFVLESDSGLIFVSLADSATIYAGSVDGTISCSYDSGATWISTRLVPAGRVRSLVSSSGGIVYAGSSEGFFTSTACWSALWTPPKGETPRGEPGPSWTQRDFCLSASADGQGGMPRPHLWLPARETQV